ncbi:endoglucanase E-4 [Patella vulgata]|uniref:endoglucanase E-4 n=1 Tax=Patella vulgata TaxID=6465 RepID=UPI00217FBBEA|nr:endoglucanase E-4 [Patella vulgata]
MFIILIAVTVLSSLVSGDTNIEIIRHWAGGFNGKFCVPISKELKSWKAHLKFDQPIDSVEVWLAELTKVGDGKEYILTNKAWNGEEHVGDKLCLEFMGHIKEDIVPLGIVYLEELEPSGSTNAHTVPPLTTTPVPHTGGGSPTFHYAEALSNSILFYDAQRSGKLPANNPIKWRGDSALNDGSDVGLDLSGGWYDAGDHVKFGLPLASTTTVLLWGYLQWPDAYKSAGLTDKFFDMIKWPLDYYLKIWRPAQKELYVQIGDGQEDHHFWGRAEDMTMKRPAYKVTTSKPGSDVAGETAASLAAGSIAFKSRDPAYSQKLLSAAKSLYAFGKAYPGIYSASVTAAAGFYVSSGYKDEMCVGAVWLYKATQDKAYLTDAWGYNTNSGAPGFSWDSKTIECQIMLYGIKPSPVMQDVVEGYFRGWLPTGSMTYTPCGFAWKDQWGSTRYNANTVLAALVAADMGLQTLTYRKWGIGQMDYILGQNSKCFSYAIGFGKKYPLSPHHRSASCPDIPEPCSAANLKAKGPSPHLLVGALVGGPDATDAYTDNREDYVHNEVACDYNAGFQSALAGIVHLINTKNYPVPDPSKCPCKGS